MSRDYIVKDIKKMKALDLLEIGEEKKKLTLSCHLCGVEVEREHPRDNAVCFDCKKKRHMVASKKYLKNRGY